MERDYILSIVVALIIAVRSVRSNLYDPHLFPRYGPFFEGWYMRFVDDTQARSFGVLFGQVLPEDDSRSTKPVFLGLIYDDPTTSRLLAYDAFPPASLLNVTIGGGHKVDRNPDVKSPAHFRWDAGQFGFIEVTPEGATVDVVVDGVHFQAQVGGSVPWDAGELGPQGWLIHTSSLLPLNWFVYSLRSPVNSYRWRHLHPDAGPDVSGTAGLVHMEKNWGESFPSGWIWTQGVRGDNVSYAIAFGPVGLGPVKVPGHLGGYRHPEKGISIDFRPDNSFLIDTMDSCSGRIVVTVYTLHHKLTFNIASSSQAFSECLYGPMKNGFRKVCSESFKATAEIVILERYLFDFREVDTQAIKMSALEFGGAWTCNNTCVNV